MRNYRDGEGRGGRRRGGLEGRAGRRPGGERGGRRGRIFDAGELQLVLLALIGEQSRHGYELIREIEARAGGAYAPSPGMVYPTLSMLLEMGLIAEADAAGARKSFTVTELGQRTLAENATQIRDRASELHRRLATFTGHRARLGRSLSGSVEAYNSAVGSLERQVLPGARRFTELGVQERKALENLPELEVLARQADEAGAAAGLPEPAAPAMPEQDPQVRRNPSKTTEGSNEG